MKGRGVIIGTWVMGFLIIGYSSFHQGKGMPKPVRLVKMSAVWTLLTVLGEAAPQLGGIMSVGMLVGLFMMETGNLGFTSGAQTQEAQAAAQQQTAALAQLGSVATTGVAVV